mgnify:CR=1 FL=1
MSEENKKNLAKARESRQSDRKIRKEKKNKEQELKTSLLHHIESLTDWLFGLSLIFAALKDSSDIINNALVAAGGAGIPILIALSTLSSVFLIFTTIITSTAVKRKGGLKSKILKKLLLIVIKTFVESIPLLSLLPLESIVAAMVYWMTLKERRESASK